MGKDNSLIWNNVDYKNVIHQLTMLNPEDTSTWTYEETEIPNFDGNYIEATIAKDSISGKDVYTVRNVDGWDRFIDSLNRESTTNSLYRIPRQAIVTVAVDTSTNRRDKLYLTFDGMIRNSSEEPIAYLFSCGGRKYDDVVEMFRLMGTVNDSGGIDWSMDYVQYSLK